MSNLAERHCAPYESGEPPMKKEQAAEQLQHLSDKWALNREGDGITGEFEFKNYYRTTAFVNAVAWIAHGEDHHPDISFGYKNCSINFTTHSIDGLSDNDFICAAKIDQLFV